MTIRFIQQWNGHSPDEVNSSLGSTEEARLVGLNLASYDLDGANDGAEEFVKAKRNLLTGGISIIGPDGTAALVVKDGEVVSGPVDLYANFRWVIGDRTASDTVAISGSVSSYTVDCREASLADATLHVVVTGSGTLSATAYGSDDGMTNPVSLGTVLSGMTSGSYVLQMSTLAQYAFYTFTFTETGGSATASVSAAIYSPTIYSERETARSRRNAWALGDETAQINVAASGVQATAPIDLRFVDRAKSKIVLTVTGSGTCKVSGDGTALGQDRLHPLGDLLTGKTAGTHEIALSSIPWFPMLKLTITETGGSSTVAVSVRVQASVETEYAAKPKVLVLMTSSWVNSANWTVTYDDSAMSAVALIEKLGYQAEVRAVSETTSAFLDSLTATYAAIVIPALGTPPSTWASGAYKPISKALKGALPIPVFGFGLYSTIDATITAHMGATVADSLAYRKILWHSKPWYSWTRAYTLVQQSHMTQLDTLATDSSGANATMWRYKGAAGWVYIGAGQSQDGRHNLLHLISDAVRAGHMPAPPKKLPVVLDIDDCPNMYAGTQTMAELEQIYSYVQRLKAPSAWGLQVDNLAPITTAMVDFIRSRTVDRGGLLYPIAHSGGWTWPSKTKAQQDTQYRADVAALIAKGFRVGATEVQLDAWGYTYFNNNAFNDDAVALGSPESGLWASPDGKSVRAGYGWKAIRSYAQGGLNTKPIGAPASFCRGVTKHRGVRVLGSGILPLATNTDPADGSAGTTIFANACDKFFPLYAAYDSPLYMHGDNCYDGHDGGNAPGLIFLSALVGQYEGGLENVVEFVHGSQLAV